MGGMMPAQFDSSSRADRDVPQFHGVLDELIGVAHFVLSQVTAIHDRLEPHPKDEGAKETAMRDDTLGGRISELGGILNRTKTIVGHIGELV